MIFKGQIVSIGDVKGATKDGKEWASIDIVVKEVHGEHPQTGVFSLFKNGEHVKHAKEFSKYNKVGDIVEIDFSLRANGYQGKWYGSNSIFKVTKQSAGQTSTPTQEAAPIAIEYDSSLPF